MKTDTKVTNKSRCKIKEYKKRLFDGYTSSYFENVNFTSLKDRTPNQAIRLLQILDFPIKVGDEERRLDLQYQRGLEFWNDFHRTPANTRIMAAYEGKLLDRRYSLSALHKKQHLRPFNLQARQNLTSCRKVKSTLLKLKLQSVLQSILATPVTITSQNILKLKASKILLSYGWKVTQSLPTQYVYSFFFQKDLTNIIVCTVLLRTSSLLSFYLARLLERIPRHTWFFHIFNRIVAVFKFYCRVPLSLKVVVKGRINKKLRKQSVCLLRTQLATSTFDSAIDYSLTHSYTSASVLGVKVWVVSFTKAAFVKTFAQKYQAY